MKPEDLHPRRPLLTMFASAWLALAFPVMRLEAQDSGTSQSAPAVPRNAMSVLIDRLVERGSLTKQDAAELQAQAAADAADQRVQAAEVLLAAAKADAAVARAQAAAAQAAFAMARAEAAAGQASAARGAVARVSAAQIAAAKAILGLPAGNLAGSPPAALPPAESSPPESGLVAAAPAAEASAPSTIPADSGSTVPTPATLAADPAPATAVAPLSQVVADTASARADSGPMIPTPANVAADTAPAAPAPMSAPAPEATVATAAPENPASAAVAASSEVTAAQVAADTAPATTEAPPSQVVADVAPAPVDSVPPAAANSSVLNGAMTDAPSGPRPVSVADVLADTDRPAAGAPAATVPDSQANGDTATRVSDALGETTPAAPQPTAAESQIPVSSPDAQASVSATEAPAPQGDTGPGMQDQAAAADPTPPASEAAGAAPHRVVAEALEPGRRAPAAESAPDSTPGDTIRVAYVPDVVRNQITQEVKSEVIAQARQEGWGERVPDWVSRFTLYGDVRVRFEDIVNHADNDNTGSFLNFNAVNTGAPYDVSLKALYPTYDVDQNRSRERLRARLGAAVDLKSGFTAGIRVATGNDDSPVSENQTFGGANNGQGGNFSKYALWLDRGFVRYQSPGDPASAFSVTMGRFDNPFFSTNLMWANDLGFDGVMLKVPIKANLNGEATDTVKPFIVAGIFPVFNTDLNFATDQSAKFASEDKWLDAVQAGVTVKMGGDVTSKSAAALYYYKNIQGQLSTPFVPTSATDQGNTDDSRPSFAQNGNTYMELRDILPATSNGNGTTDQWQYFGLATPFHDLAFTQELDYTHFEPFDISLVGEYVTNLAFKDAQVAALAVNNLGPTPTTGNAPFIGGNKGWFLNLKVGDALLSKGGDWNVSVGYRHLESDAVVDGFTDSDFGGILAGTNLKGFTLGASIALAEGIWIEGHFYSASAIAGPTYKNDLFQLDLNAKF